MGWHFGQMLRKAEGIVPSDRLAVIESDSGRSLSWLELASQSAAICAALQRTDLKKGAKVAFYSRNRQEYITAFVAVLKLGLVHINVNFRYREDELLHIFENSDAEVVFFDAEFSDTLEAIRPQLTKIKLFVEFGDDGEEPEFDGAVPFTKLALGDSSPAPQYSDSLDDEIFIYTGGTTGMPKGVVWKHNMLFQAIGINMFAEGGPRLPHDLDEYGQMVAASFGARTMVLAPLMHGMGLYTALGTLLYGGTVVINRAPRFSAELVLDAIDREKVFMTNVAGDAMAKPLFEALERNPNKWSLESLMLMVSSAAIFSPQIKRGLIGHIPNLTISDNLGGSESSSLGNAITNKANVDALDDDHGVPLQINEFVKVFDEEFNEIEPGSDQAGLVGRSGIMAEGYYKDPEKTGQTFPTIDGERYVLMGDYAKVLPDKTIRFLGRGNICINTGGEKVFPEEVEQALKLHPDVNDCAVVGVPDERWGNAIVAIIQLEPGRQLDVESIRNLAREKIADYKVPKYLISSEQDLREANGKLNYPAWQEYALQNT